MSARASLAEVRRIYRWGSCLTDTLITLRRRFGGDLDQYLLYMTVVQAEMERTLRPGGPPGLNALSLAEVCGLPRETARTKLRRMTDAGLLAFDADNLLRLSDPAAAGREYGMLAAIAEPKP